MRVLVTGATAPLGEAIVARLLATPDIGLVLAVGRDGPAASHARLVRCAVDLTHARAVRELVHGAARDHEIDNIVHAAQHRAPGDRGRRVHAQNVEAARALVRECAHHPTIRRFIHRSFAEVYAQDHAAPGLIDEDAALELDPHAPQWLRDRVEADLTVCAQRGGSLEISVLRCAELLAPGTGSQLWDYLSSRVCLRPVGFDPVLNVLSLDDAAAAFVAAVHARETGVFNIHGADTLPLSRAIAESHRHELAIPGRLLAPLYKLRRTVTPFEFRYDLNVQRFHCGGVLDGSRARRALQYEPRHQVRWPGPWLRRLAARLAANDAPIG
jgi:UDP-glucose 4-epimerase